MRYGVQLYSLRSLLRDEAGYARVFAALKGMGAQVVQLSGGKPIAPQRIRDLAEENGLTVCITHDPFDRLEHDLDAVIAEHRVYGCDRLGVGMMPARFRTGKGEDLARFIAFLNTTADRLRPYGMSIAYHNHWFEFDPVEGVTMYDRLIRETDPAVQFIPDTYWMRFRRQDCCAYLQKLAGRVNTLHAKDYKRTLGVPLFRAVGKGELDFGSILACARQSGVEHVVVELDASPRPLKSVQFGLQTLLALGAAAEQENAGA